MRCAVSHELYQPLRSHSGDRARVIIAFYLDDGADQLFRDLVKGGRLADDLVVALEALGRPVARGDRHPAPPPAVVRSHVEPVPGVAARCVGEMHGAIGVDVAVDIGERRRNQEKQTGGRQGRAKESTHRELQLSA
jgi:hypothetical protein